MPKPRCRLNPNSRPSWRQFCLPISRTSGRTRRRSCNNHARPGKPDQVACATPDSARPILQKTISGVVRDKNARLREKINSVLKASELVDATELIALRAGLHVQVGTTFLEQNYRAICKRARAIIERRPDLENVFDD